MYNIVHTVFTGCLHNAQRVGGINGGPTTNFAPNPLLKVNLAMQRTQKLLGKLTLPGLN